MNDDLTGASALGEQIITRELQGVFVNAATHGGIALGVHVY